MFSKQVNLEPSLLKEMDLKQKRDCMDEINKRIKTSWYFSSVTSLVIMIFIVIYTLVAMVYTLRTKKLLDTLDIALFIAPLIIFVPAFFANMMKYWAIIASMVAYSAVALYFIVLAKYIELWVAPAAIAGVFFTYRLLRCYDMYKALCKEPLYPDFCELKDNAEAVSAALKEKEKPAEPLNILTETAIMAAKHAKDKEAQSREDNSEK